MKNYFHLAVMSNRSDLKANLLIFTRTRKKKYLKNLNQLETFLMHKKESINL